MNFSGGGVEGKRTGGRLSALRPRNRGEVGCTQVPWGLPKSHDMEVTFYAESGRPFKSVSLGEMNSDLYF